MGHCLENQASSMFKLHSQGLRRVTLLLTLFAAGSGESRGAHTLAIQVMAYTSMQAIWAYLGATWTPAPSLTAWRNTPSAAALSQSGGAIQGIITTGSQPPATMHPPPNPQSLTPHDEPKEGAGQRAVF